jgi:hypothetical protein
MNKLASRAIALLLGCGLSAALALGAALVFHPLLACAVLPASWHQVTLPIDDAPENVACLETPDTMRVISTATAEHDEPLVKRDVDPDEPTIRAEFSGSWAERRVLQLSVGKRSAVILASYETDYGNFGGSLDAADSRIHRHAGKLCFELSVRRLDGSSIQEHWIGQVLLP